MKIVFTHGYFLEEDPKEKMICLIMTQHTPNSHYEYADKIMNIIYGSLK